MEKKGFEIRAMEYLKDALTAREKQSFEDLLEKDDSLNHQFLELKDTWELMDEVVVPEPTDQMDASFFDMLDEEIRLQKEPRGTLKGTMDNLLQWLLKPQLAYALLFLVLLSGYFMNFNRDSKPQVPQTVDNSETEQVREKLVLTLLEQSSANKRLEGVSEANKIGRVDEQVINALLRTLNKDPNVNVRLAAIESLTNYVGDPKVRQGLIQSIPNQESPIIQVTLANLMLALEERKSIEPFKQLLEKPELDTTVKKKIEKTIKSII